VGRLNAVIWAMLGVLAIGLVLSFILNLGPWSWGLVAMMVVVLALDFLSRLRRGR
jgi:hypothetical protein